MGEKNYRFPAVVTSFGICSAIFTGALLAELQIHSN
jgi:hypothetical protein